MQFTLHCKNRLPVNRQKLPSIISPASCHFNGKSRDFPRWWLMHFNSKQKNSPYVDFNLLYICHNMGQNHIQKQDEACRLWHYNNDHRTSHIPKT